MFDIRTAETIDVEAAVATLGAAFADDPLMLYFFRTSPLGIRAAAMEFFSILLRARIALQMPAYVLERSGSVSGLVMGYDTSRPAWPEPLNDEFRQLEAQVPGLAERLAAYDEISHAHEPAGAHYYLGVIGVHPALQGMGAGRALIDAFCALSRADRRSGGVYLETGSRSSLQFYIANGFELRGEGQLENATLWCVFKPT